jgi:predicted metal-dependent peptidase
MALSQIDLAKSKIALHSSFMISLTSKLQFEVTDKIPTAGTNGRKVLYNQKFVDSLTLPQAIGLICHEVWHNMYSHMARLGGRNMQIANIAMDIALNQLLELFFEETKGTLRAEFPPNPLGIGPQFAKYKDWNWEKIYADLMEQCEKNGGKCGHQQFDFVEPATNQDGSAASQEEAEGLAKEWAMAAQQAATMAKSKGNMPGMFEEFISNMVKPKVNWRAQVWDAFTKTAKDDVSWQRFNRRYVHTGIYLPGRYSERLGFVAFYVDTSGSMGSKEFELALGCINEVMEDLQPEHIMFGQCDTRMQSAEMVTPDDLPLTAVKFKGRGGTILTPMFEHAQTLVEPELVVVLTDGYHEQISRELEPHCPTVWLVTTDCTSAAEGSFGRVIRVEA